MINYVSSWNFLSKETDFCGASHTQLTPISLHIIMTIRLCVYIESYEHDFALSVYSQYTFIVFYYTLFNFLC